MYRPGGVTSADACPDAAAETMTQALVNDRFKPNEAWLQAQSGDHAPSAAEQIDGLSFAWLLVDQQLVLRAVNIAAENLLGRSRGRLVGRPLGELVEFGLSRLVERIGSEDSPVLARDLEIAIDGREMCANVTASPVPVHCGWWVITISDAGQGYPSERSSNGERTGLRGPAVLAHEIKNPLAAIRGAAQLLARSPGDGDERLTKLIVEEVDRIAALVDRMQYLGRAPAAPLGPVNLHAAIRAAVATLDAAAGSATFQVIEEFDPSLPAVHAHEGALVQVLVNLIDNARVAASVMQAPRTMVRTRFVSDPVTLVARFDRSPARLPIEIQVIDNGPGIDPALADAIFEPFVSGRGGQGLGLALVSKLVRDMDGRIAHDRDERAGLTRFRLHLAKAR